MESRFVATPSFILVALSVYSIDRDRTSDLDL
jgi:hypothetical protein